jgi:hypothetical protein
MDRDALADDARAAIAFFREMAGDATGDRGCVLVAHAFIDEQLEVLLTTHLNRISNGRLTAGLLKRGPSALLGMFSPRAKMATALGLIDPKLYRTLRVLNKLRNDFAHQRPVLLDDAQVKRVLDSMGPDGEASVRELQSILPDALAGEEWFTRLSTPRVLFMVAVMRLMFHLSREIDREKRRAEVPRRPLWMRPR